MYIFYFNKIFYLYKNTIEELIIILISQNKMF